MFADYRRYSEYIPIFLIGILFIAEADIEKHAVLTSYQIAIMIITLTLFYLLLFKFGKRHIAALLSIGLWIGLVYIKHRLIPS